MFKRKKLGEGQLYFMHFQSDFRDYIAIGNNLNKMANNIIKRYNTFCTSEFKTTLEKMAEDGADERYMFYVTIIDINSAAADEYWKFDYHKSYEERMDHTLGDYLEVVRKRGRKNG